VIPRASARRTQTGSSPSCSQVHRKLNGAVALLTIQRRASAHTTAACAEGIGKRPDAALDPHVRLRTSWQRVAVQRLHDGAVSRDVTRTVSSRPSVLVARRPGW
jgi:hypothetical protein